MRELDSRKIHINGDEYEIVVLWEPESDKVFVAAVTEQRNDISRSHLREITKAQVKDVLDHPTMYWPFKRATS